MIVLALLEARARHGYELAKLIESQSEYSCSSTWRRSTPCSIGWSASAWWKAGGWRRPASVAAGSTD